MRVYRSATPASGVHSIANAPTDETSYHRAVPKRTATSVWISVDMEGIGGVATYSHVMMQGVEYERARRWMADEANACIEGAAMPAPPSSA